MSLHSSMKRKHDDDHHDMGFKEHIAGHLRNMGATISSKLPVLSAHTFTYSNWQLLYLNQRKGENGHRNYFMTKSLWKTWSTSASNWQFTCSRPQVRVSMAHIMEFNFRINMVFLYTDTVMILSFQTDMPGQTVQTQIRLLEEQSDQGLHCSPFHLHCLDSLLEEQSDQGLHCSPFHLHRLDSLLKEQSDRGLHCPPFHLHCLDSLLYGRAT